MTLKKFKEDVKFYKFLIKDKVNDGTMTVAFLYRLIDELYVKSKEVKGKTIKQEVFNLLLFRGKIESKLG